MEFLSNCQQVALKRIINRLVKIIENGYAYTFIHPEAIKKLQCEANKINEIEKLLKIRKLQCYEKMLRDSYIRYIVMLTKLGLQFASNNPKHHKDFMELQKAFAEYDHVEENVEAKQEPKSKDFRAHHRNSGVISDRDSTEEVFHETYHMLNNLCSKFDSIKHRVDLMSRKCKIQKSRDGMNELNNELIERLKKAKLQRKLRIHHINNDDEDGNSDRISSEEVVQLVNLDKKTNAFQPVRVGPIQRNIIIPLKMEDADEGKPKIVPKYFFRRDNQGNMTFDIKLNFENGVVYNDKCSSGIYIESELPKQNVKKNRK